MAPAISWGPRRISPRGEFFVNGAGTFLQNFQFAVAALSRAWLLFFYGRSNFQGNNMTPTRLPGTFVCFSHLRWSFVYQRPQHLLSRAAQGYRVIFVEEPIYQAEGEPRLQISSDESGVTVVTPHLPHGQDCGELLDELFAPLANERVILWYYTPLALAYAPPFKAELIVYDCMDELSAFKFAPPELKDAEAALLKAAHVVFTGGQSLYEAKRGKHPNVHAFPSSVDARHFAKARQRGLPEPREYADIPHPRLGFFGVIDERFDIELLEQMADLRPDWSFVMIGPVVKIDPQALPKRANIHWLGGRDYKDLPEHLAHWDVGIMPFALNESTRYISPTKTPEFLAAGLPVVSAAITDVVRPYGELGRVEIARSPEEFVRRCEGLLTRPPKEWLADVDDYLSGLSWDRTWNGMLGVMREAMPRRRSKVRSTARAVASKGAGHVGV